MKQALPDFSKKLISVTLAGEEDGRAIDRPRWELQGGRLFLVGTVPPDGSTCNWCEGIVSGVAWDKVTDYLVFDSAKHYRERLRIYEKGKRKA